MDEGSQVTGAESAARGRPPGSMEAARSVGTFVVVGGGIAGVTCAEQVCWRGSAPSGPRGPGGRGWSPSRVALPAPCHAPPLAAGRDAVLGMTVGPGTIGRSVWAVHDELGSQAEGHANRQAALALGRKTHPLTSFTNEIQFHDKCQVLNKVNLT